MDNLVNKNDVLANLKPLIAPEPISWWPLAPGWWLVGTALLLIVISLLVWGWKRWQYHCNTRYQREALQLLETADSVTAIALLIRRVAINVLGRSNAATAAWHEICSPMTEQSLQLLAESQYRPGDTVTAEAMEHLRQQTQHWIKKLPAVKN